MWHYLFPSLAGSSSDSILPFFAFIPFFLVGFVWLFFFGLMIFGIIFWILMIIDCIKREFPKQEEKLLWIVVLLFAQWIGAIIYYILVKRQNTTVLRS